MSPPTLVMLAAGASRRYGRPKQLDPLGPGGETIMELTARDAAAAGVDRVVLVLGSGPGAREVADAVEARMRAAARRDGWDERVRLDTVHQRLDDLLPGHVPPPGRTRPWGTAHAVRAARPLLGGTGRSIVVVNADDWYGPDALARIVGWAAETRSPREAALVPYPLSVALPPVAAAESGQEPGEEPGKESGEAADTAGTERGVSRGLLRADAYGRLLGPEEHRDLRRDPDDPTSAVGRDPDGARVRLPIDRLCSMNLWAFGPAVWYVLEHRFARFLEDAGGHDADGDALDREWLLPEVVREASDAGELDVRVLEPGTVHLGVTHPEDRVRVRHELASRPRS